MRNEPGRKYLTSLPYLLIPVVLATWLYAPALFCGKTQIHGDSITYSLSVIEFDRKMLHENISPLWTDLVYGGHPYFAESQGGFLNPLNLAVALFFNPVVGQNIYHWLSIILGAMGMYLLCRHFIFNRDASTFSTLTVVFSAYWLNSHHNITISSALCWIPWAFLSLERWIENPTGRSALCLALAVSLLIFSGYPQAFHGAIIYMTISFIPTLFSGYIGSRTQNSLKQYLVTGIAAITVCAGLTAVQWLPLLELTTWSHRSGGIDLVFPVPLYMYVSGFLFTFMGNNLNVFSFGSVGSVLVCYLASLSLTLKPSHRMIGHIMASIFLIILGLEYATPLFGHLLKYRLVPGIQFFRGVHLYLGISIIGIGLLGGFAIDKIQKQAGYSELLIKDKLFFCAIGSVLFFVWGGLVLWFKSDHVAMMTYVSFIASYIILMVFIVVNKSKWLGHAVLFLIAVEIMTLRMSPFPFFDIKTTVKPPIVQRIQGDVLNNNHKLIDLSARGGVVFIHPWAPELKTAMHDVLMRALPSTNVLWNVASIDANLALPLSRQKLTRQKMEDEILGMDATQPGNRLIDYLGICYIITDVVHPTTGIEPLIIDSITFLENKYVLPRVQTFTRYEMANSADDALNRLKQSKEPTLILEPPFHKKESIKGLPASTAINISDALEISSSKITNVAYKFDVHARQPGWLFIADANYPGWQADIDGQSTPVYSAQVLGKAVFVPSGIHKITVEFKPRSFMIGLFLMFLTLLILLIFGIHHVYSKRFI